jgi:hypothetical protein
MPPRQWPRHSRKRSSSEVQHREQYLRGHRNQNAGGHVLVVVAGDDVAHFARQNEGQGRVIEVQARTPR